MLFQTLHCLALVHLWVQFCHPAHNLLQLCLWKFIEQKNTCMIDMDTIDDSLVRVEYGDGLARLQHVKSDDFGASDDLNGFHSWRTNYWQKGIQIEMLWIFNYFELMFELINWLSMCIFYILIQFNFYEWVYKLENQIKANLRNFSKIKDKRYQYGNHQISC